MITTRCPRSHTAAVVIWTRHDDGPYDRIRSHNSSDIRRRANLSASNGDSIRLVIRIRTRQALLGHRRNFRDLDPSIFPVVQVNSCVTRPVGDVRNSVSPPDRREVVPPATGSDPLRVIRTGVRCRVPVAGVTVSTRVRPRPEIAIISRSDRCRRGGRYNDSEKDHQQTQDRPHPHTFLQADDRSRQSARTVDRHQIRFRP